MFEEQVGWAAEAGVDFIVAETYSWGQEALIALEVVKQTDLPVVVMLAIPHGERTFEGWTAAEACRRLEAAGADVVGLNCLRGPQTMLPLLREIREAVSVHVAGLPVPYHTTDAEQTFFSLTDPRLDGDRRPFPDALDGFACTRYDMADFGREATELGRRLHRGVLRRRPAPRAQPRRGARPHAARQPLHGRHVQARVPRHRPGRETGVPGGVRPQAVKEVGAPARGVQGLR